MTLYFVQNQVYRLEFSFCLQSLQFKSMKSIENAMSNGNIEAAKALLTNETQGSRDEILFNAAASGAKDIVQLALTCGANVNVCHKLKNGEAEISLAVVSVAALTGHKEIVELLLNQGAKQLDIHALLGPAFDGKIETFETFKLLLDRGFDVNYSSDSGTALSLAASNGFMKMIQLLLDNGANIDGFEDKGASPIVRAAVSGHEEVIKLLLDRGARWDSKALCEAVCGNRMEVVKLLLDRGFDANTQYKTLSALCYAAASGNKEMAELLLNRGANVNGGETLGDIPIIVAAVVGHREVVELLLQRGAERSCEILSRAVLNKQMQIVKLLLDQGFDVNGVFQTTTPLLIAASVGNLEITELLLDFGADINGLENEESPIDKAVLKGHRGIVALLLKRGADINREVDGMTALTIAIHLGKYKLSKLLIRHMILMKGENLDVSQVNLNAARLCSKLTAFQNKCAREVAMLHCEKFDNSSLTYFNVYTVKDVDKLTALASNENIVRVLKSKDFKKKFPIYGRTIIGHFDKGVLGKKDFELFKRFCDYLSTRKDNRLPKLPFTFVCEIFTYLTSEDVDKLRSL